MEKVKVDEYRLHHQQVDSRSFNLYNLHITYPVPRSLSNLHAYTHFQLSTSSVRNMVLLKRSRANGLRRVQEYVATNLVAELQPDTVLPQLPVSSKPTRLFYSLSTELLCLIARRRRCTLSPRGPKAPGTPAATAQPHKEGPALAKVR